MSKCMCVFAADPPRRLIWYPEGSLDGALCYPRGRRAICYPKANTPADASASPGSAEDGQEGRYHVGRGGGIEGFFYPGRAHWGGSRTDLGVWLDAWAEGGLGEAVNCNWADSWGLLACEGDGKCGVLPSPFFTVTVFIQQWLSECYKKKNKSMFYQVTMKHKPHIISNLISWFFLPLVTQAPCAGQGEGYLCVCACISHSCTRAVNDYISRLKQDKNEEITVASRSNKSSKLTTGGRCSCRRQSRRWQTFCPSP